MSKLMKLQSEIEQRLGHYATRLFRIEAHMRQGETRAAERRLEGFARELEQFEKDLHFPAEAVMVGAQLGFFSGKGSLVFGRLPAALVGAVGGWMFGQSTATRYDEAIEELRDRISVLEMKLQDGDTEDAI